MGGRHEICFVPMTASTRLRASMLGFSDTSPVPVFLAPQRGEEPKMRGPTLRNP